MTSLQCHFSKERRRKIEHKLTNVERIALERQRGAKTFIPTEIRTIDLPLYNHVHYRLRYLALNTAMLQSTTSTKDVRDSVTLLRFGCDVKMSLSNLIFGRCKGKPLFLNQRLLMMQD